MRMDAAHTLVVPYDATPDMVNQAYERRLAQRFGLQNEDKASYVRGIENLYDARVRMKTPVNKQWRAQLRLMAVSNVDKMLDAMMTMLIMARRDSKSINSQVLVDELMQTVPQLRRRYNMFRGLIAYELTGLGAMMVYNNVVPNHGPIIPMVAYGTMILGGFAIGSLMDSMERDKIKIAALTKLLSFDKVFQNEK
ncbi:MAG: hypothetical protein NC131_22155, partial [Roseburia sp.]|nr:hypothetical protein [Roseburia sp.]